MRATVTVLRVLAVCHVGAGRPSTARSLASIWPFARSLAGLEVLTAVMCADRSGDAHALVLTVATRPCPAPPQLVDGASATQSFCIGGASLLELASCVPAMMEPCADQTTRTVPTEAWAQLRTAGGDEAMCNWLVWTGAGDGREP